MLWHEKDLVIVITRIKVFLNRMLRSETASSDNFSPKTKNNTYKFLGLLPFLILFAWMLVQTAWIGDDAYITFRSIENFIHGYGPVYNIGERVQTFTHPLWFLAQSVLNWVFIGLGIDLSGASRLYFVNVFASMMISLLTMAVFGFGIASDTKKAVLGISALFLSKAYLDYSTSGLENPFSHLIIVIFLSIYFSGQKKDFSRLIGLSLCAALTGINRLDHLLLFLPLLFSLFWENANKTRVIAAYALGFLPLIAWELFSLTYYGSPFPNTASAKLNTGISFVSIITQGGFYYLNSLRMDPITLLTIFASILLILISKDKSKRAIIVGMVLYLFYIIYIGGDFMSGRYFTAPLLMAAALLSRIEAISFKAWGLSLALIWAVGILPIYAIPERSPSFGKDTKNLKVFIDSHGISDERRFYYGQMGFLPGLANGLPSGYKGEWVYQKQETIQVELVGTLGVTGYRLGPNVHVIDRNALADPLMGRMPLQDTTHWRIGHFRHVIPDGYLETLASGENQIKDPNIRLYYEKLSFVIKGDLWSWPRFVEIWNLNVGKYDYLIKQ